MLKRLRVTNVCVKCCPVWLWSTRGNWVVALFFSHFFFFLLSSTNLRSHWPRRGPNPNNSNFSFCPTHFILSRKMTASMSFSTRPTMWEIPREICVKSENANWPMCELCTQSNTQMRTQNLDALQMPIMIGWMHMHHDHRIRVNKWSHLSPIAPGEKKKHGKNHVMHLQFMKLHPQSHRRSFKYAHM